MKFLEYAVSRDIKKIFDFQMLGGGGDRKLLLIFMLFLLGVMKIFLNYIVMMNVKPCEFTKNPEKSNSKK